MKHVSNPINKGLLCSLYPWQLFVATGIVLTMLVAFFSFAFVSAPSAFATSSASLKATYTSSPTQGPVGAVIVVTGKGLNAANGAPVQLGYIPNNSFTCNLIGDAQVNNVNNQAFSGWFRWPAGTGTGTFGVCASVSGSGTFAVGVYHVLSASAPQVTVTPGSLNAGKSATVSGTNFLPAGTSVVLVWQAANGSQTLTLGTVTADNTGAFNQTFTVPANSSTGSYNITASVGNAQPPTLSGSITFHVDGITIAPVATAGSQSSPTATISASPTAGAVASVTTSGTGQSGNPKSNSAMTSGSGVLVPVVSGGVVLIIVALVAGIFVVRKQRGLAAQATARVGNNPQSWPDMQTMGMNAGGSFAAGQGYRTGNLSAPGSSGMLNHSPGPGWSGVPNTEPVQHQPTAIPFDPALAEAMRQAQVSLFAMPRPPINEEVPF